MICNGSAASTMRRIASVTFSWVTDQSSWIGSFDMAVALGGGFPDGILPGASGLCWDFDLLTHDCAKQSKHNLGKSTDGGAPAGCGRAKVGTRHRLFSRSIVLAGIS